MNNHSLNRHVNFIQPLKLFPVLVLSSLACDLAAQEIAGWVEKARLMPSGIELKAKLDTGAKNSSLNALKIDFINHNGSEHVRFRVKDKKGKTVVIEQPVIRQAAIKRHFTEAQKRPVVMLEVCLGNTTRQVEVNLVDRGTFNYPLLLGRSYLAGQFLIDPGATFKLKSQCTREVNP